MPEYEEVSTLAAPMLGGALGQPKTIKIMSAIAKAQYKKEGRPEANDVCMVLDLDPENPAPFQQFTWVVPAIAKSELEKGFPKAAYVGQVFRVTRYKKGEGGKASPVALVHLKVKK